MVAGGSAGRVYSPKRRRRTLVDARAEEWFTMARRMRTWVSGTAAAAAALALAGCLLAAAGAGAGGAIYVTDRGAEAVIPAGLDRAATATRQAFDQLKIHETKSASEAGRAASSGTSRGPAATATSVSPSKPREPAPPASRSWRRRAPSPGTRTLPGRSWTRSSSTRAKEDYAPHHLDRRDLSRSRLG